MTRAAGVFHLALTCLVTVTVASCSLLRSDPVRDVTAILLTQRAFDGPKPAPLYDAFERIAGLR